MPVNNHVGKQRDLSSPAWHTNRRLSAWDPWRTRLIREARSLKASLNPRFELCQRLVGLLPNYALCSTRAFLYRVGGCDIDAGVTVQGPLVLLGIGQSAARLHVGDGTIVGPLVMFGLDADIRIGRNVSIGPGTAFHTATHAIGFASRRMQLGMKAHPIVVENGAWIGAQSLILPGVTIGRGSIVAAGGVVTTNIPPNVFVEGNPATVRDTLPFGNR